MTSQDEATFVEPRTVLSPKDNNAKKRCAPRMKVSYDGETLLVAPDHSHEAVGSALLMEALGTTNFDFMDGLLTQLSNAGTQGRKPDGRGINFMLSVVQAVEPRDELE